MEVVYLHDTPVSPPKRQIGAIRTNADSLEEVECLLQNRTDVVLTADDGYRSNLHLLPLLERYRIRLLLFVTTGFIDRSIYPYEVELSHVLGSLDVLRWSGQVYHLQHEADRDALYDQIRRPLKPKSFLQRETAMHRLAMENGYDRGAMQQDVFLRWEEISEMARHPFVEVGSHGVSHVVLTKQNPFSTLEELRGSKHQIESKIGKPVSRISYPYGSSCAWVRAMARWAGYREGYGTRSGGSSLLNLHRFSVRSM